MKPGILSTRKLTPSQRELLLNAGFSLVEKDFISIEPIDFSAEDLPKNLIFTSKNSVEIFHDKHPEEELKDRNIFCVGEKTAALLTSKGFSVKETQDYGADLGRLIVEQYKDEEFVFFCGRKRNPDLPEYLRQHQVNFREIYLYDTRFTPSEIDRIFEGVLFFSPSGVQSFCSKNSLSGSTAFCIGTTTAAEAQKHTRNIVLATKPTIESVIVQVIKHFG